MAGSNPSGSSLFRVGDIKDWPVFLSELNSAKNTALPSPGQRLWTLFPPPTQTLIEQSASVKKIKNEDKFNIINELNKILERRDFYQEDDFSGFNLPDEIRGLLSREREDLSPSDVQRLNRLLLETAYPHDIAKSRTDVQDFLRLKDYFEWSSSPRELTPCSQ